MKSTHDAMMFYFLLFPFIACSNITVHSRFKLILK